MTNRLENDDLSQILKKKGLKSQTDNCDPAVSFLKELAKAAKKMEPDKEYTLEGIEILLKYSNDNQRR